MGNKCIGNGTCLGFPGDLCINGGGCSSTVCNPVPGSIFKKCM
jgi:hypothetical protein